MSRVAHPAGPRHADVLPADHPPAPPNDLNALHPGIWPRGARRSGGVLTLGGSDVRELAAEFGTPLYVCDEDDVRSRCRDYTEAFGPQARVFYAAKAFCSRAVLRWVSSEGLGIDVCTGGELEVALSAGGPAEQITLHGNNKTLDELARAISAGVGHIVTDSFEEIARLAYLTGSADPGGTTPPKPPPPPGGGLFPPPPPPPPQTPPDPGGKPFPPDPLGPPNPLGPPDPLGPAQGPGPRHHRGGSPHSRVHGHRARRPEVRLLAGLGRGRRGGAAGHRLPGPGVRRAALAHRLADLRRGRLRGGRAPGHRAGRPDPGRARHRDRRARPGRRVRHRLHRRGRRARGQGPGPEPAPRSEE